jgi:hypothetical protein
MLKKLILNRHLESADAEDETAGAIESERPITAGTAVASSDQQLTQDLTSYDSAEQVSDSTVSGRKNDNHIMVP